MGIMAGQKRTNLIYIVSYLLMSVLALAAIGLLLIFAATGLARDTDAPHGFFVDQEVRNPDGSNRPFSRPSSPLLWQFNPQNQHRATPRHQTPAPDVLDDCLVRPRFFL